MITIKLQGRLGNQLFQYAFAYSIAKKLNTNFFLDAGEEIAILYKYFNLKRNFLISIEQKILSINGFKNLFSVHLRSFLFKRIKSYYSLKEINILSEKIAFDLLENPKDNTYYIGFFQSEYYFKEYQKEIKNLFSLKRNFVEQFKVIEKNISKQLNRVVIHIRRGDYLELGWNLPTSYYHEAIKKIHHQENFYIFISDDATFVENEFGYLPQKYISKNSEIIDFQFLMSANICILSPSSFSWWGAYLNPNENKKIYVPAYFLGWKNQLEFPAKIIPNNWHQLSIN